ncbi:CBS domain-containing protein, partial [bacterium]|nr:CBS domain-containing protein [bacterium]
MPNATIAMLRNMLASLDDAKKYQSLRDVMSTMNAADLAAVFEDLPPEKMPVLFRLCPKDLAADVFAELSPETQQALINGLTDRELKVVVEELCADDAADLVEEMPASVVKRILAQAEPDTRKMINELLKYPEDSAGGVMTTEFMELSPDWTVRRAMQAIRANGIDKETINNCYVTQSDRTLVGVVSLRTLVLEKDEDRRIDDLMDTGVISVTTGTDREQTSQMFEDR